MDPPRATATEEELKAYYDECIRFLKERVSYCFKEGKGVKALGNQISTWSKSVARSRIDALGTDSDKGFLMKATNRNKPKRAGTKLKRNRSLATSPKYPDRQNKRQRRNNHNNNNTTGNDSESRNNENNENSNEYEDGDANNNNNNNNNDDSNIANQNAYF